MMHNCKMYSSDEFEKKYTYAGDDLGVTLSRGRTEFKVWSPFAESAEVYLYESGDISDKKVCQTIKMEKTNNGVWVCSVEKDLEGLFYCYHIKVEGQDNIACDPYARAVGVNGNRAMIINLDSTNPDGWEEDCEPFKGKKYVDSIIYEMHIRDFSIGDAAIFKYPGKYLALAENGVKTKSGKKAGLDYLKELGITHVHLLPISDFATVDESTCEGYNWGYDPKNYNVPEGSYSTDAFDGSVRIRELKKMVYELHKNGIAVVMDVVYNHTYNNEFCFNKIVPEYFFRVDEDGNYSNGSGCGNDVATERSMVRKYIVDSVRYWAKEYHIDGFRFDLMGLMDIDTMNAVREAVDEISPDIILYGEGWNMATELTKESIILAKQKNTCKLDRIAMFNDDFRDAIKGKIFYDYENGYVSGNMIYKEDLIKGILAQPDWACGADTVVNFVSCHDNNTLFDKLEIGNKGITFSEKMRQNMLSALILFTSQGMVLFHAGEELMRTKIDEEGNFVEDSVRSGDFVNSIKWEDMDKNEYICVSNYYKGLIRIRKHFSGFKMRTDEEINNNLKFVDTQSESVIAFCIDNKGKENTDKIFVIYNPDKTPYQLTLPKGQWNMLADMDRADLNGLRKEEGTVEIPPVSGAIFVM